MIIYDMYDVGILKKYEGESMDEYACVGWRGKAPNKVKLTISGTKHEQNIWIANFKQFLLMQNMNDRPLGWIEPSKDCWATCAQKDPIGKVDIPWTQGTLRSYIVLVDQHRSFIFIRLKFYTKWPKSSSESHFGANRAQVTQWSSLHSLGNGELKNVPLPLDPLFCTVHISLNPIDAAPS